MRSSAGVRAAVRDTSRTVPTAVRLCYPPKTGMGIPGSNSPAVGLLDLQQTRAGKESECTELAPTNTATQCRGRRTWGRKLSIRKTLGDRPESGRHSQQNDELF